MPQKVQYSSDNPGWLGSGMPSIKKLNAKLFKKGWNALRKGQFIRLVNKGRAMIINAYHFTILKGKKTVECPCCGWQGPAFLASSPGRQLNINSNCPMCDSRSRHRGLAHLLPKLLIDKTGNLLIFAPEKVILDILDKIQISYQTTDLNSVDVDFPGEDIQALSFADASFDGILNNHVLEHIPDDQQALRECFRVMRPGGLAIFTLAGNFERQETKHLTKPDCIGHYRYYGLDVCDAFKAAGFEVEVVDLGAVADENWGVRKGDMAFVCRKPCTTDQ